MKKLYCNFTTPEQSKRLLELGLPADSADCIGIIDEYFFSMRGQKVPYTISMLLGDDNYSYAINPSDGCKIVGKPFPCWSVGRLIEIHAACAGASSSYYIHTFPTNIMNEVMWHLTEAIKKGWVDFSKLED